MMYRKNLPTWERAVRLLGASAMALCAWRLWGGPGGVVFAVAAVTAAVTAVVGFCPMCAVAGRRLDRRAK